MSKTILITGATSGFGKAAAAIFAENGSDIIITGRREDRLKEIQQKLSKKHAVTVNYLCFDIRDAKAVSKAIKSIENRKIDVLINNAGLASGISKIQDGDIADWEKMIDTNIKGLLYVSKAVIPMFIKQKKGHIINIGSTAGKEAYLNGNVYCGTKHAIDAISKSMRIDF